jgi:hypothetical protein
MVTYVTCQQESSSTDVEEEGLFCTLTARVVLTPSRAIDTVVRCGWTVRGTKGGPFRSRAA